MNVQRQMCWCFKVFFGVFGNLTERFLAGLLDVSYKMWSLCCCNNRNIETDDSATLRHLPAEEFYKEVSRGAAENLLKSKQNGTFIIRPSKNSNLGTLSVIQNNKVFHLNIRLRQDNLIALGTEKSNEKCFRDIDNLIDYYVSNYLVLYSNDEKTLTLLLPYREKVS